MLHAIDEETIELGPLSFQEDVEDSSKTQHKKTSTLPIQLPSECVEQQSAARFLRRNSTSIEHTRLFCYYFKGWNMTFWVVTDPLCKHHHGRLQDRKVSTAE
jgi:hypothetical protein